MTATEELRRMLTERGVEWWQSANTLGCIFTRWYSPIFGDEVVAMENGKEGLVLFDHFMTPEQAIAATLGPREQPPYDELIEALRRDWDIEASWDGLRRFWYVGLTDEGVRKRDEREATLGRGECHNVHEPPKDTTFWPAPHFKCSECGATHVSMGYVFYCPNCGRKVVDE